MLGAGTVKVNPGTPDFEFDSTGQSHLLEARAFDGHKSDSDRRSDGLKDQILVTIKEEFPSKDRMLALALRGQLNRPPKKEDFVPPIRRVMRAPIEGWTPANAPSVEVCLDSYSDETCRLDVSIFPKPSGASAEDVVGLESSNWAWLGAEEAHWAEKLLGVLREKAKRLEKRLEPSYVAASVPSEFASPTGSIATRALYGVSEETGTKSPPSFWRDGLRSRNRHVKGVIVCGKLLPHALDSTEMACCLFMAPGADEPPEPLSRLPRVWLEGSEFRSQPGETLGSLVRDGLGLPT